MSPAAPARRLVSFTFTVYGLPVVQGKISYSRYGRGYHPNGRRLRPWRKAVGEAAQLVCPAPMSGPIALEATVTLRKPASAPKRRITWPVGQRSGDWDHYGRAISDALSGVVFHDDCQVVEGTVRKVYPDEGLDALPQPGALIRVHHLGMDEEDAA